MTVANTVSFTDINRGGVTVISAEGFIDASNAYKLAEKFEEEFARENYSLIINLDKISFIGSAGWGILLSNLRKINEKGGCLKLTNMNEDVECVFKIMEFFELIEAYPTEQQAVTSFRAQ